MRIKSEASLERERAYSKARYWREKKERENNPELQEAYRISTRKKYMNTIKNHGDARREYNRKYYQEHKEYFREYYKNKKRGSNENISEDNA
jgi:hypothetical protein